MDMSYKLLGKGRIVYERVYDWGKGCTDNVICRIVPDK